MKIREMIEFLQRYAAVNNPEASIDEIIQYLKRFTEYKYVVEGEKKFYEESDN